LITSILEDARIAALKEEGMIQSKITIYELYVFHNVIFPIISSILIEERLSFQTKNEILH
jgi:hypothetical protein